jgi:hypothetical protein
MIKGKMDNEINITQNLIEINFVNNISHSSNLNIISKLISKEVIIIPEGNFRIERIHRVNKINIGINSEGDITKTNNSFKTSLIKEDNLLHLISSKSSHKIENMCLKINIKGEEEINSKIWIKIK